MSHQRPAKIPPSGSPLDLGERMLDDLSRLFHRESSARAREAERLYTCGDYVKGALAELASQGLEFDSREIARLAVVASRFRQAHHERNLLPWERLRAKTRPPPPF